MTTSFISFYFHLIVFTSIKDVFENVSTAFCQYRIYETIPF